MEQEYAGKKLLLLGGTSIASSDLVRTAKRLGIYVIVADYISSSEAKQMADESWDVSTADIPELARLARKAGVSGVLAGVSEFNTLRQIELAQALGLPCCVTKELWSKCMDKQAFKQNCLKHGIPATLEVASEALKAPNCSEFPVIIKPVDGSAGEGISICANWSEAEAGIKKAAAVSASGCYVIERYYIGEEVTMFYFAQDGRLSLLAMGDRHICHNQPGTIPLPVGYTFPSKYLDLYLETLNDRVIGMLKDIGVQNGAFFIQSLVQDEKEFIFYEAGCRLNGCQEFRIVSHAEQVDILALLIQYALAGKIRDADLANRINPVFSWFYGNITFLVRPGKIGQIRGLEQVRSLPDVIAAHQMLPEGASIKEESLGTLHQVVARVFHFARSRSELEQRRREIARQISVTDAAGRNMLLNDLMDTVRA